MLLAIVIYVATLVAVVWRPRGLGIGWGALGGAAMALAAGVVHLSDVPVVWGIIWNATLTLVAIIIISFILDEVGFFEWAALHVARWGRGRGRELFPLIVLLGAATTAVFSNDGAALILTPIVMEMMLALGFGAGASLAFVMATGFVADATSLPFVVSNLVNIVIADFFGIDFDQYARVMLPVGVAALAATLLVLYANFRREIPPEYDLLALKRPEDAIRDPLTFRWGWAVLALLVAGYFGSGPLGVPVSVVAGAGAAVLAAVAGRWWRPATAHAETGSVAPLDRPVVHLGRVVRGAPWQIVFFSLGMYLVVFGLRNAGLTSMLADLLGWFAEKGSTTAAVGTGFVVAVLSATMNNLPTTLVGALSVAEVEGVTEAVNQTMVYATVIGADLGPKMTPIGSLATLLWLHVLARKGMRVGWGTYLRIGVVLTLPVLLLALLALDGWLRVTG
ncbi:arsenic transporter [Limnochorda pilosa]|uniref:Arsenical pump membrane protein n=1 Tax=Limnochorda pilosa TaxID=1555112 RepID=A0A0K2SGJ1_LIMPI|nr:arsenic transporter [Limnochorda pilosa]BAS26205.1 arsenical pump membrane protein [Limnochorda pilosa]